MRPFLLFLTLGVTYITVGQNLNQKVTFSFQNTPMEQALIQIESQTGYHFYYREQWVKQRKVTGQFKDVELSKLLEALFKATPIHFYEMKPGQIVLTENSRIIDRLPKSFLATSTAITNAPTEPIGELKPETPVFLDKNSQGFENTITTFRVGKEGQNNNISEFQLQGRILEGTTNRPVPDIAVVLEGTGLGTSSDANGNYAIALPNKVNTIRIQGIGYQSTRVRVIMYNHGSQNFFVFPDVEELNEVIVEGELKSNVEKATTGAIAIDVEGIKNIPLVLGERDILKTAIALPGITNAGEGAAGFNVRGGRTDQNLILLDNGIIYNPTHFFGIFSALNTFTTGAVEIYKGHIPSEYGGRLSSVFDIRTKDGNTETISGEASIGPVTTNIMLETPIIKGKSSLIVGGRATYSNWILRSLDNQQLQNSEASFFDVVGKYHHRLSEKSKIQVTGYYSKDAFSITSDSIFDYSNRMVSLQWDHEFNTKNSVSIIGSNSRYQFGIEFDGESNNDFRITYQNTESELKIKGRHSYNPKHTLTYGLATKLYVVDPGGIAPLNSNSEIAPLSISRENALESALFLGDNFEVNDKMLLDVGARYSFYAAIGPGAQRIYEANAPRNSSTLIRTEQFDNNAIIETYGGLEGRISARYLITPDLSVKASFNNTLQYIHTLSNNTTVSPTDTWKLSDSNIKPQRANQYAIGLYKNYEGNNYEISLEGYYKRQRNLLDYKVGAQLLLNESIEQEVLQGDGKAYGIELLVKKNAGRLNGWLGYTYSRSFVKLDSEFSEEQVNNGAFFPSNYDKPHDLSIVTNYKFTKRFSASANFVYQTGRPVTFPIGSFAFNDSEFVFYSDRNTFRIPDYYRLDLSFNMEGNHKIKKFAHSFWSFSIYNVLGRNNPYSVFFVTENGDIRALQSSIFAIPVPTISYNFKF